MENHNLRNKSAIVTGGASGSGERSRGSSAHVARRSVMVDLDEDAGHALAL